MTLVGRETCQPKQFIRRVQRAKRKVVLSFYVLVPVAKETPACDKSRVKISSLDDVISAEASVESLILFGNFWNLPSKSSDRWMYLFICFCQLGHK